MQPLMINKRNYYNFRYSEAIYLCSYVALILTTIAFQDVFFKPRAVFLMCIIIMILLCGGCVASHCETKFLTSVKLAIFVLFATVAFFNKKPQLVIFALLICYSDLTSFERVIGTNFVFCGCSILITPLFSKIGVLPTNHFFRDNGLEAHAFGFGYYQVVPYTFFFMVLEYFYLNQIRKRRLSWLELFLIFVINYVIFKYSTLRLTYYLTFICLLMYILLIKLNCFDLRSKWIKKASIFIYPASMLFTILLNKRYDQYDPVLSKLNHVLSNRLYLGHEALNRYHIVLFGQEIRTSNAVGVDYFYVDSGYLYSLIGYGVLLSIVLLAMHVIMLCYSIDSNDKALFIWLVAVAIFSFSNNIWISLAMNPLLLGLFSYRNQTHCETPNYKEWQTSSNSLW